MAGGNSVGRASLILSTAGAGLKSGLDAGYKQIQAFKARVGGLFGKVASPVGAVAGLAGIVSAGATVEKVLEKIADASEQGKLAKSLGMSAEGFGRIAYVAKQVGSDTKSILEGLIDMAGRANDALSGGQMQGIFEQLKLDPNQILGMGIEDRFYAFARAISAIDDPADKARIVLKVFGEDIGKQLLPLMAQGEGAIRQLGEEAVRAGAVLGSSQMAGVERAQAAMKKLETATDGAWLQLSVAATPLVEVFADLLGPAVQSVTPLIRDLGDNAIPIMEGIAQGAGYAWDMLKVGMSVVSTVAGAITTGFGAIVQAFGKMTKLAQYIPAKMRPAWVDSFSNGLTEWGRQAKEQGLSVVKDSAAVMADVAGGGSAARWSEWVAKFGEKRARELAKAAGKDPSGIAQPVPPKAIAPAAAKGKKDGEDAERREQEKAERYAEQEWAKADREAEREQDRRDRQADREREKAEREEDKIADKIASARGTGGAALVVGGREEYAARMEFLSSGVQTFGQTVQQSAREQMAAARRSAAAAERTASAMEGLARKLGVPPKTLGVKLV